MRGLVTLTTLSAALVGQAAAAPDAVPVTGNPVGVVYKAALPEKPFFAGAAIEGNVKGYISATAGNNGEGVKYTVKFENLPKQGGPFMYHIHVDPAKDGNCTTTLAHLDPFARGEETPCDTSKPASCQVGDLSGKYGTITSDPFEATYVDAFSATKHGPGAFFGNRSFVLHYANKTRLTCANFKLISNSTYNPPAPTAPFTEKPSAPTGGAGSAPPSSATPGAGPGSSVVPSDASALAISGVLTLVAAAGFMMVL